MLLLTATGAKSGERRTTPVMYLQDGDRMVIFASKGGAPNNPGWYHNLRANPSATVHAVAGAGHMIPWDEHAAFLAVARRLLTSMIEHAPGGTPQG